jgi:hypothetical protein
MQGSAVLNCLDLFSPIPTQFRIITHKLEKKGEALLYHLYLSNSGIFYISLLLQIYNKEKL